MSHSNSVFNDLANIQEIALEKEAALIKFTRKLDLILDSYKKILTQFNRSVVFPVRYPDPNENLETLQCLEWKNGVLRLLTRSSKNRELEAVKSPDAVQKAYMLSLLPALTVAMCKIYNKQIKDYSDKLEQAEKAFNDTHENLPESFKTWINELINK